MVRSLKMRTGLERDRDCRASFYLFRRNWLVIWLREDTENCGCKALQMIFQQTGALIWYVGKLPKGLEEGYHAPDTQRADRVFD
jgi:hypothetical protein